MKIKAKDFVVETVMEDSLRKPKTYRYKFCLPLKSGLKIMEVSVREDTCGWTPEKQKQGFKTKEK